MATEIWLRAERRAGELLKEMAERGERHAGRASKGLRQAHSRRLRRHQDF